MTSTWIQGQWERYWLPTASRRARQRIDELRRSGRLPRVALLKQDCNEDLYCCAHDAGVLEMLQSTLLRSGPIALFTTFDAQFRILQTEADPECQLWREKWDPLRWCPPEWFEAFRERIPGRDHGQSRYAVAAESIDWSRFDLVISVDVAVPARLTRRHPDVVWAYFIRELKAPSYATSFGQPVNGQDLYLSHLFAPRRSRTRAHVIDFPYHFQYCGLFHQLLGHPWPEPSARRGVFVEHHTARAASDAELAALEQFGPVHAWRESDDRFDPHSGERIPERSMSPEGLRALLGSKYHVKWGGRAIFGTAKVEAIAAGCLVLRDRGRDATQFLQSPATSVDDFGSLVAALQRLEADPARYDRERSRQQALVDYLCFLRPACDLIDAWHETRLRKTR